jgi:hypothetical protein
MQQFLREPFPAAVVGFAATVGFLVVRTRMNGEETQPNHYYIKPAVLVALLVYMIVYYGQTAGEPLA